MLCPGSYVMSSGGLIVLGFNYTSTLVGHFVLSPREREKRDRRESRGDEREEQGRKRKMKKVKKQKKYKHSPSTLTCYKDSRPCPTVSQYQLDAPVMQDTGHLCHTRPPKVSLCYIRTDLLMCAKRKIKSACTSRQSDQSLCCLHAEFLHPWLSKMCPVKILIKCMNVHMNVRFCTNLQSVHMSESKFSEVGAHNKKKSKSARWVFTGFCLFLCQSDS